MNTATQPTIFRDLDLPITHLQEGLHEGLHFVPPKAHDEEEIERRRQLPPNVLISEFQEKGVAMASAILKHVDQPASIEFARRILPAAGVNTAWYSYGFNFEHLVQRRRLKLPDIYANNPEFRPSSSDLRYDVAHRQDAARHMTFDLIDMLHQPSVKKVERARYDKRCELGRTVGHASLILACEDFGDELITAPISEAELSNRMRQRGMKALHDARTLHAVIGRHPSFAAFADPDSHQSVFWRREAPTDAVRAYRKAEELVLTA